MKSFVGILAVILLLAGPVIACAENEAFGFIVTPENVYPGRLERISYQVPGDGPADLELVDRDGNVVIAILSDYHVAQGVHHLTWDGSRWPEPPPCFSGRTPSTASSTASRSI